MEGVERLGEILEKVVASASPPALLFVGWRDMPRPADPGPAPRSNSHR